MAVPYYGDFPEDATVRIPFNTFSSNDPQASVTITDLVDADLRVHKDGSVTQIVTDGATITIDHDSITGAHYAVIDTSVHADYVTGSEYAVKMVGTTVDAGTINAWIGAFSIERTGGAIALLTGANSLADIETKIDTVDTVVDGIQTDLDNGTDGLGAIKGDTAATLTDTADMQPRVAAIEVDTNELQGDWVNGGRLDLILDIIAADTTTDIPALIAALNDLSSANILTEVNSALDTAISELGVAAPTATPTMRTGLMLLYMALRNRVDVDTTGTDAMKLYNDAGTQIASKVITDDGTDYSEAEMS